MWVGGRSIVSARRWAAGLAVLAMFLQVMVPQGFMAAREGGWPAIVICTGHGPVLSRGDLPGHPAKAPKSKPDVVCAFAHGAGAPPPSTPTAAATKTGWTPDIVSSEADLIPGRGLVAPPPPSQGPPNSIL